MQLPSTGPTIPPKLKSGDRIEVVAPATSAAFMNPDQARAAQEALTELSLNTSFSPRSARVDRFKSASVEDRLKDLHEAFENPEVNAILTVTGGFNSNQVLDGLDFDLIAKHPKIVCGYSDITALTAALRNTSDLVTYSGPHFSTLGIESTRRYTLEYFEKCLMQEPAYEVVPSTEFTDHPAWYKGREPSIIVNPGLACVNPGAASGEIICGNLCTLALLQGTPWAFNLANKILFIEEDRLSVPQNVGRLLHSLLRQPGTEALQGLVFGRFESESGMDLETLQLMIRDISGLASLPIIANADFGHTLPMITIPMGGQAEIVAIPNRSSVKIVSH
jgi:muramoyltetrapeptide carboxypeptidase